MKFSIIRSVFIEGLKSVQSVVGSKGTLPVLQNVLLECNGHELKMTTTDLDISTTCSVECKVEEQGASTLPVKLLVTAITKAAEGEVHVDIDATDIASISAGSARFRISGLGEKEFPRLPQDAEASTYDIPAATLKEMIRKTAYAASQDDTRRTLKGELMSFRNQKLTMVATDGRRLALVENEMEYPPSADRDIVLPSKAVMELQRSLGSGADSVKIKIQKSQICFELGKVTIYSKLMEDAYPNYMQVIPKESREQIAVDRQMLLDALDRASVMTIDESHSTKLIFDSNTLTVTSAMNEIGYASDEVPIKYVGERLEIMFNPNYVMDPLKAIDDDEVRIELNDGHSPAVIKCSIPFLYVLMPLRTN
ncbi:MAG: DNA polymerase III subunit beta [Kiritimatiellae bacterium]|nr:DNA polymerase III subunit beta [Kiritimatiellia bacterium]